MFQIKHIVLAQIVQFPTGPSCRVFILRRVVKEFAINGTPRHIALYSLDQFVPKVYQVYLPLANTVPADAWYVCIIQKHILQCTFRQILLLGIETELRDVSKVLSLAHDEDTFAILRQPNKMGAENYGFLQHIVPGILYRVVDYIPGVAIIMLGQILDILQQHVLWFVMPGYAYDIKKQCTSGLVLEPHLLAGMRKRLARKTGTKHIEGFYFSCIYLGYVSNNIYSVVLLVDLLALLVYITCKDAPPPKDAIA